MYSRKDKAVRALKTDFIENDDYLVENQSLPQNGEQKRGGQNREEYWLSVPCLEYFIVKKVRPVFEVYRQVFHKVADMIEQGKVPTSFAEALELAAKKQREIEQLELENNKLESRRKTALKMYMNQKERADYHRMVSDSRMKIIAEKDADLAVTRQELREAQPAIDFATSVMDNGENCLVGTLAKMISQCGISIGRTRLFEWLRNNDYVGKIGSNKNIPHQQYIDSGIFVIKENNVETKSGEHIIRITAMVTPKGQQYFVNKFRRLRAEKKL